MLRSVGTARESALTLVTRPAQPRPAALGPARRHAATSCSIAIHEQEPPGREILTGGSAMLELGLIPAGHQDQRDCCGCNREQCDHAGGLGPSCSGRPPDLGDQASKWAAWFTLIVGFHPDLLSFTSAPGCQTPPVTSPSWGYPCLVGRSDSFLPSRHAVQSCCAQACGQNVQIRRQSGAQPVH